MADPGPNYRGSGWNPDLARPVHHSVRNLTRDKPIGGSREERHHLRYDLEDIAQHSARIGEIARELR